MARDNIVLLYGGIAYCFVVVQDKSRSAVVVGGAGFLGSAAVSAFLTAGWTVTRAVRPERCSEDPRIPNCSCLGLDLLRDDPVAHHLSCFDVIILAAAVYGPEMGCRDLFILSEALRAARLSGSRVVYTSGAAVYGEHPQDTEMDETDSLQPVPLVGFRLEAEKMVSDAVAEGLKVVSVRPGWLWGGDGALIRRLVRKLLTHASSLRLPGSMVDVVPFVHRDDLAELYLRIAEHSDIRGAVNAVSEHLSREEIAHAFGAQRYEPTSDADAETVIGPIAELVAQSVRLSASRARNCLGWEPQHLLLPPKK